MTPPAIGAVIVNFNAGDELRVALRSIADELGGIAWEGVVVDNASTDGSADAAGAFAPEVMLIRNSENVGFGRGVNQAVARTSAPLVLVMNPDSRLRPGAIAALRAALDADPACAVAGPRILDPEGTPQGSARGDPDMLTGLFGRSSMLRRLFPGGAIARRNVLDPQIASAGASGAVVDWVSGACMLVRRRAFDAVHGFDERYFLYWEDADLCRRLRAHGFTIRYAPGATVVHRVGRSSRSVRSTALRAFHQSAYLYYATHVAPRRFDPRRFAARALLAGRCWWLLRRA